MKAKSIRLTCKALLFDLDGVLVDSTACIERTWRSWSARHGLDAELVVRAAHGRRAHETVVRMAPHLDVEQEVAALIALESTASIGVSEFAGARNLLASLPVRSWAIVTSGAGGDRRRDRGPHARHRDRDYARSVGAARCERIRRDGRRIAGAGRRTATLPAIGDHEPTIREPAHQSALTPQGTRSSVSPNPRSPVHSRSPS